MAGTAGAGSARPTRSVHTTINVLEGLRLFELHRRRGRARAARCAAPRARVPAGASPVQVAPDREDHQVRFTRFVFPPRWHYDILRALDHFQAVDAPRDPRLAEAIEIVRSAGARMVAGRCNTVQGQDVLRARTAGAPSRWNTLRALRVLKWWDWEERDAKAHGQVARSASETAAGSDAVESCTFGLESAASAGVKTSCGGAWPQVVSRAFNFGENQMHRYGQVSGTFFAFLAIMQATRVVLGWPIQVAAISVPVWASVVAVLITGSLAIWAFRTAKVATKL